MDTIDALYEDITKHKLFAWDLETESKTSVQRDVLDPRKARLTHIALAGPNTSACFDASPESIDLLVRLLTNPELYHMAYNAPYDLKVMNYDGHLAHGDVKAKLLDPMGLAHLVDEEDQKGLKYAAKKFCNIKMTTYEDVVSKSPHARKLRKINETIAEYDKVKKLWFAKTKKRPWPKWDSPLMTRTAIGREIKTKYPDRPTKEIKEQVEDLFNKEYFEEYCAWVRGKVAAYDAQVLELKAKVNEDMKVYAQADAANLFPLAKKLLSILKQEEADHVIPIEMAIHNETIAMHLRGVRVDVPRLEKLRDKLTELRDRFQAEAYDIAKREFKINSSAEVKTILFEELGVQPPPGEVIYLNGKKLRPPSLTEAGKKVVKELDKAGDHRFRYMTVDVPESIPEEVKPYLKCDSKVLERIAHPFAKAILNCKVVDKLLSTYATAILARLEEEGTDILHASFKNFNTVTNRFSSQGPNLQNIPGRGKSGDYHEDVQKVGLEIRECFIPHEPDELAPEGYGLIQCDHSQIELRITAHVSGDPVMCATYNQGVEHDGIFFYTGDIHLTTQTSLGCKRKDAKGANFGSAYGSGPLTYARQNNLIDPETGDYDVAKAKFFLDGFFATYKKVRDASEHCAELYKAGRRLFPTIAGRWRHFYDHDRGRDFKPAKGKLFNSTIQGSAGDALKYPMYMIRKYLYPMFPGLQIILQIHDEIILLCPKRFIKEAAMLVKYIMEYPWYPMSVPVLSGAKIVDRWSDAGRDDIPEVGTFYAEVDGEPMTFTERNWGEFIKADNEGRVGLKSAVAQLTPQQMKYCASKLTHEMPPKRKEKPVKNLLSRAQMKEMGML